MPLRYQNDKPEKSHNFKGLEVYQVDFLSFSNPKKSGMKPLYRRGCSISDKNEYRVGRLLTCPQKDSSSEKKKCPFAVLFSAIT